MTNGATNQTTAKHVPAVPSSAPSAALEWLDQAREQRAGYNPPAEMKPALESLQTATERKLKPATAQEYAVAMGTLADYAEALNLPETDPVKLQKIYREALEDLPADLLMEAIKATIKSHRFNTIPKPGEIRSHVADALARRHTVLSRTRIALSRTR